MLRGCYIICGIVVAALVVGCEEGGGSAGGGTDNSVPSANKGINNEDPGVFLPKPLLAAHPNEDVTVELYMATTHANSVDESSAPSIVLGQISDGANYVNDGAGYVDDALAMNDDHHGAYANAAANPEPLTATLGLMGMGVLGMAIRRRVA